MDTQPASAPRPTGSQVLGARIQIYARRSPGGYAVRGAALAAVGAVFLAVIAASPSLADPTGTPGWTLVGILCATVIGALLAGLPMYLHARSLPEVGETDPVRYAAARLQAASGRLGPDPDTNRLARGLSDRLVRNSNPAYAIGGLFVILLFVTALPLADVIGPGFEPLELLRLAPGAAFLIAFYSHTRAQHTRFKAFRESYDAAST
jgi:peptidoglycan/LPS O-acetylase OafA/YrhL